MQHLARNYMPIRLPEIMNQLEKELDFQLLPS